MHAVVEHADAQEQRGGHKAVRDHLHQAAFDAELAEQEEAERHEAHVRDRRVRDEFFHVGLHQRDEADVDHRDQRQRDDKPGEVMARIGQDRQDKAYKTVRSDLQRDGGEDD